MDEFWDMSTGVGGRESMNLVLTIIEARVRIINSKNEGFIKRGEGRGEVGSKNQLK